MHLIPIKRIARYECIREVHGCQQTNENLHNETFFLSPKAETSKKYKQNQPQNTFSSDQTLSFNKNWPEKVHCLFNLIYTHYFPTVITHLPYCHCTELFFHIISNKQKFKNPNFGTWLQNKNGYCWEANRSKNVKSHSRFNIEIHMKSTPYKWPYYL